MSDAPPARLPLVARDSRSNLIRAFKASGCAECKRRYPELDWSDLHIDHIDPRDKRFGSVGNGPRSLGHYGGAGTSVERMMSELLACQVLCVECHKAKHRNGNGAVDERQLELFTGSGTWVYR